MQSRARRTGSRLRRSLVILVCLGLYEVRRQWARHVVRIGPAARCLDHLRSAISKYSSQGAERNLVYLELTVSTDVVNCA